MQHVKKQWLSLYAYTLLALDFLFFAAYIWFNSAGNDPSAYAHWGITPLILPLAGIHALYIIFAYPIIRRKSEWFGAIGSQAIFIFLMAALIETSKYNNLTVRIGYILLVFTLPLTGPFVPIATICATWVFLLYTYLSVLGSSGISIGFEVVIDLCVTAAGIIGWLIFKRFYVKKTNAETVALSKLLKQEQFKSNVMLEAITDGVMVIGTEGTVQVLNQGAAQMLGWVKQEALKLDYRSLLKPVSDDPALPNQTTKGVIAATLSSQQSTQGVSLLETHNNRRIYVDIVASPIFDTTEPIASDQPTKRLVGVIAVLRDVDKQKRQEQQRSDFISTASHEMRTPVASIQGYLELALNPKVCKIDPKATDYLTKATQATKHLGQLFQDLLTVSKSEDGHLENKVETIELPKFLQELFEDERGAAEAKGLKPILDVLGGDQKITPLLYVTADPARLREVVINLFENAIKYTEQGMITLGASLRDQQVVIRVSDTGIGIAEEDIPHLFQKFYRVDNSETRQIGGTGLGLFIAKELVENMNGRLWVESKLGEGSTFFVELPRANPETNTTDEQS